MDHRASTTIKQIRHCFCIRTLNLTQPQSIFFFAVNNAFLQQIIPPPVPYAQPQLQNIQPQSPYQTAPTNVFHLALPFMANCPLMQHTTPFPGAQVYLQTQYIYRLSALAENLITSLVLQPTIQIHENAHQCRRGRYRAKHERARVRSAQKLQRS